MVPVCRMVPCQVCDPCTGCCHTVCHPVTEMQAVCRTVMQTVPVQREVTVNVCTYHNEVRHATRLVCENVARTREVTVNVYSTKTQKRESHYTAYECVARTREVTANVVSYKPVARQGHRTVVHYETVMETVNTTEYYCEMVAYPTTVRVPVYASGCGGCGGGDAAGYGRGGC